MTIEAQRTGERAELRVKAIADKLGLPCETSLQLDYGEKTDIIICGVRFQVSTSKKSNKAQKLLAKRGVYNLVAGEQVSDLKIIEQIRLFIEP